MIRRKNISREERAGRVHWGWSPKWGSHQPLRWLLSLSTSPSGAAYSLGCTALCAAAPLSLWTNSLCLLRAFLLLHHFGLHLALTLTLFLLCLTQLPTVNC